MVQQQHQTAANGGGFTLETPLALPSQINNSSQAANTNGSTTTPSAGHSQYSPQASLYQQQLIKSAQQFIPSHQQQQITATNNAPRHLMNGLNLNGPNYAQEAQNRVQQQQNSPSQQIYTHPVSRQSLMQQQQQQAPHVGSLYAPKPAYYQAASNGSPANNGQQQQLYQTTRPSSLAAVNGVVQQQQQQHAYYGAQQQHSPSMSALVFGSNHVASTGAHQLPQAAARQQLSAMSSNSHLFAMSPVQQVASQQQQQQQQQFVQQQQQAWPDQATVQYQQQQLQMGLHGNNIWNTQQQAQQIHQTDHSFPRRPNETIVEQHQQLHARQQQQTSTSNLAAYRGPLLLTTSGRFSDRDSISTVSRTGGADDRRSITMRSQFTQQHVGKPRQSGFGFVRLTGEALRQLLGMGSSCGDQSAACKQPLLLLSSSSSSPNEHGGQLAQNVRLAAGDQQQRTTNNKLSGQQQQLKQANTLVADIDSGEDYYFKRKVFKYRLALLRCTNLLLSVLVLLSPVIMLLLPKMEPIFGVSSSINEHEQTNEQSMTATNVVVTHGLGLQHKQAAAAAGKLGPSGAQQQQWRISECVSSDCDGPLVGFVLRLIMLGLAHWAIFFRQQTSTLPRIDVQRSLLIGLALLITLAYWLFFMFRVFDKRYNDYELHYTTIIQFSISMLETLILLHYLALVMLEFRQRRKVYCLKVVRSPDGASKYYTCGELSIQQCGEFVLDNYHQDFAQCDTYAERMLALESDLARQMLSSNSQRSTRRSESRRVSRAASPAASTRAPSHEQAKQTMSGDNDENDDDDDDKEEENHHSSARRRSHGQHRRWRSSSRQRNNEHHSDASEADQQAADQRRTTNDNALGEQKSARHQRSRHQKRKHSTTNSNNKEQNQNDDNNDDDDDDDGEQAGDEAGEDGDEEQKIQANKARDSSSSDATSSQKMKESSLETVRAVESNSTIRADLEINEQPRHANKQQVGAKVSASQNGGADLESVRSGRSRRSTGSRLHRRAHGVHHHHHHDHHNNNSNHHHHHHHRHHDEHRSRGSSRRSSRSRERREQDYDDNEQDHEASDLARQDSASGHETGEQRGDGNALDEHERKLRRRRLRLLASVEEAFSQVRQLDVDTILQQQQQQHADSTSVTVPAAATNKPPIGMDAWQAARSMYPTIARSLQRYLRLTKQTGRHNLQSIYEHLAKCLVYKLNARAFLEKFINMDPVWQQNETKLFAQCRLANHDSLASNGSYRNRLAGDEPEINSWSLICDTLLSRQIDSGTFFLLKQGQISLLVTVAKLPHLNLVEQVVDQNLCRYSFSTDRETTAV